MTEKLNIGVIGAGRWAGLAHLPGFTRSPLSEVVAICDLNRELAEKRAEEFNIDSVYTDYLEMLKKEELDVVDVCTGGARAYSTIHSEVPLGLDQKPLSQNGRSLKPRYQIHGTLSL